MKLSDTILYLSFVVGHGEFPLEEDAPGSAVGYGSTFALVSVVPRDSHVRVESRILFENEDALDDD